MDSNINKPATDYINSLNRIGTVDDAAHFSTDVLLFPKDVGIIVDENSNVKTIGFDPSKDIKAKDLLRIIEVKDAQSVSYSETNILSPSVYVHSLPIKPWHITTQAFLVTRITNKTIDYLKSEDERVSPHYSKHNMDRFWLPCSKPLDSITSSDLVCIFNRRVSGWDGSLDRPVIELLGAGGHLQTIWDNKKNCFRNRSFEDNLRKEFSEEVGLEIMDDDMQCIGGFTNNTTQELVVFYCIFIDESKISTMQKYALNNIDEDTDGIYLGTFAETIKYYRNNPLFFAGGEKAANTNFPNNAFIVNKICSLYSVELI